MDLVAGVRRVVVVMEHIEKSGAPKLIERCTLPLTGARAVDLVITDLCVIELARGARTPTLIQIAPGVGLDEIAAKTGFGFEIAAA